MSLYPIQLDLIGKRCVVVGGGNVAERKVKSLLDCDAEIFVIAPQLTEALNTMVVDGDIQWISDFYKENYLSNCFLVFAATNNPQVNQQISQDAHQKSVLICRADFPQDGNFITPTKVTRGDLQLTISTAGKSPTLAAVLREEFEEKYGTEWAELTELIGNLRNMIQGFSSNHQRRAAVQSIINNSELRELLKAGQQLEAEARARQCLSLFLE